MCRASWRYGRHVETPRTLFRQTDPAELRWNGRRIGDFHAAEIFKCAVGIHRAHNTVSFSSDLPRYMPNVRIEALPQRWNTDAGLIVITLTQSGNRDGSELFQPRCFHFSHE